MIVLAILAAIVLAIYYSFRYRFSSRRLTHLVQAQKSLEAVLAAYRRGDYQTALREAEGLKKGSSKTLEYCFFRGSMLYELGKLPEAEATIRKAIPMTKDPRSLALTWEKLGYILMEQGRYADAIPCFETCVRIWSDRGCGHRAIAEAELRQGAIQEALSRARHAVEIDRKAQALTPQIHNLNLGESLATLAWAVAEDSRDPAAVEQLLAEAFPLCGEDAKPLLAQLHYHAGRAHAALGLTDKSAYHFRQAAALDPQGNFGRLAQASTAAPASR